MIRIVSLIVAGVALAACSLGPTPSLVAPASGRASFAVETPAGVTAARADQLARLVCRRRQAVPDLVEASAELRTYRCRVTGDRGQ